MAMIHHSKIQKSESIALTKLQRTRLAAERDKALLEEN